jgi:phosphoribosylanthranilate isomerase
MNDIKVKICGLTIPSQAERVVELGADMVGIIFAKQSKRLVAPEVAAEIVDAARPAIPVGVFVDSPPDEINDIIDCTKLAAVQLHGDEPPDCLEKIIRPCIKAFKVRDRNFASQIMTWFAKLGTKKPMAVMLDAYHPKHAGGAGVTFNWQLVAEAREAGQLDKLPPLILAGGLKPENVVKAIELVRPWGVDAASGVEISPGMKDMELVDWFIDEAKGDYASPENES